MPRPHRTELAGGIFHVTARGNRKGAIYLDDLDREIFIRMLEATVSRYVWLCHAFCLMPNHFHLVIETPVANLSAGMQLLNGKYGQRFNWRHEFTGHVFQGRFHSKLVKSDWHLLELSRYVVLNPVRAGLCSDPAKWQWSSLRATLGRTAVPPFLTTDWLLSHFGSDVHQARSAYEHFVRAALPSPS